MTLVETRIALYLIACYPECIAWLDFKDVGNGTGRLDILRTNSEIVNDAVSLSNVKIAMPKYSDLHIKISKKVRFILHQKRISYDWLVKTLSRILGISTFKSFYQMLTLSILIRSKMKQKGLQQITSLNEVLN